MPYPSVDLVLLHFALWLDHEKVLSVHDVSKRITRTHGVHDTYPRSAQPGQQQEQGARTVRPVRLPEPVSRTSRGDGVARNAERECLEDRDEVGTERWARTVRTRGRLWSLGSGAASKNCESI